MNQTKIIEKDNSLCVEGPLTFDTVPAAFAQSKLLIAKHTSIQVDFSKVTKSDSACLAYITAVIREAKKHKKPIQFFGVGEQLSNLVRVGGLDSIMPIYSIG